MPIELQIETDGCPDGLAAFLERVADACMEIEGIQGAGFAVRIVDDEAIRILNRDMRGIDKATDVLSFPLNDLRPGEFDAAQCECDPETGRCLLGDMALSLERCERQGEEFGHGFERELQYLAVHSTLHLLGYDHVDEGEMKRAMRAREKLVMQRLEAER